MYMSSIKRKTSPIHGLKLKRLDHPLVVVVVSNIGYTSMFSDRPWVKLHLESIFPHGVLCPFVQLFVCFFSFVRISNLMP